MYPYDKRESVNYCGVSLINTLFYLQLFIQYSKLNLDCASAIIASHVPVNITLLELTRSSGGKTVHFGLKPDILSIKI